ncbi:hypothetical protein C1H46_018997 [Malus baccata]|uniref:Uncharacterized protein n=1 Tax=Malus baccata TaxID=106549 RepID=A0A540MA28_MALBA|nr:hypothetical protein C1H46_018997 [Malus baccata]
MLVVPARLADIRKMLRRSDEEGLLNNLDTMLKLNPYAKIARSSFWLRSRARL